MDKTALFNLSYGVYIVSTMDGSTPVGCVANSVIQVSATPATLAISINKDNYTHVCLSKSKQFAVSILSENAPKTLIGTFGFQSGRDGNKFENTAFITTKNGNPVLTTGVCAYIECEIINAIDCHTHTVFLANIIDAAHAAKEAPMTYAYYHRVIKGKAPKNAPTYQEAVKVDTPTHVCSICGYTYDDTHTAFEALPDTYICPICSAPKSLFECK